MTLSLDYRKMKWFIVAWITFSTVLNLRCRQGLYLLAPVLREQFQMTPHSYAKVVSAFLLAYPVLYTRGGLQAL